MKGKVLDIAVTMLAPVTSKAGLTGMMTYTAAEVPVQPDPAKLPRKIVGDLLRVGEMMVLGSTSKSRKSWALLHLAICKAHGLPWLGWEMDPGKVLYVDLELIPAFFDLRMAQVCKALNVAHPENLICWPIRNARPKPTMEQLVREVGDRFKGEGVELVILEPSYKMVAPTTQGTNSEMEVMKYLEAFDDLTFDLQATGITSHHSPKGDLSGRASIDLFSGTGVWARHPDVLCTMRPHEKSDHVILDLTRRHGPPVDAKVVRWASPLHEIAHGEDPSKIRTKQTEQKAETGDKVREVYEEAPDGGWTWTEGKKACQDVGISQATYDRRRRELVEDGVLQVLQDEAGRSKYRLRVKKDGRRPGDPF